MLAHVVASSTPTLLLWISSLCLFAGLVAAIVVRSRWRRLAVVISGLGLVAVVALYLSIPPPPSRPIQGMAVHTSAVSGRTTALLAITVCKADGGPLPAGEIVLISVDGQQQTEGARSTYDLSLPNGIHTVRVEVLNADHREFAPLLSDSLSLQVTGSGGLPSSPPCQ